jgi:hypothetical protein
VAGRQRFHAEEQVAAKDSSVDLVADSVAGMAKRAMVAAAAAAAGEVTAVGAAAAVVVEAAAAAGDDTR